MRSEPLAIIGLGAMFPGAASVREFWCNVRDGVDSIREVPPSHWSPGDYFDEDPRRPDFTYGRRGGFLDPYDFDPLEFGISPADIASTDTTQLLGLVVAKAALDDAGYGSGGRQLDRRRTSVVLGVTGALELVIPLGARLGHPHWKRALDAAGVDPQTSQEVLRHISESYVPWTESSFPGLLGNVAAGRIAGRLDLHGTNCVVDAACASSMSALHLAALELETGRADMVLAGGLDTFNDIFMYMCFSKTPALSPTGDARPFDRDGDGTILGEGLGVLAVRRLADAQRDGDRIYAVIPGIGTASDGRGVAVYEPSAAGQARALRDAYEISGVDPATVELVEAHGTGTRVGDATEVRALSEVFGESRAEPAWCALGSVNSNFGHTKAAAGAAGLIKAVLALHHRVLPPTLKVESPNEALDGSPFYANRVGRPWPRRDGKPRRAAVSAFGFGGTNFHCVLEEAPDAAGRAGSEESIEASWSGAVQLVAISGADRPAIAAQLAELEEQRDWRALRLWAAARRSAFRHDDPVRLALVLERQRGDHSERAAATRRWLERGDASSAPESVYLGEGAAAARVALVFPGQGAQKIGMLRELLVRFPEAAEVLHAAEREYAARTGGSLIDRIYPAAGVGDASRQEAALRATDVAQPALGVVELAAWRVLRRFGLPVEVALGHSFGELVAVAASGRIAEDDLHRLALRRGQLMARVDGDSGAMLALLVGAAETERLLADTGSACRIANLNAPQQVVVSGGREEIDRLQAACRERGIGCARLNVSAAFHSRFVAAAVPAFSEEVERTRWRAGEFPVLANSTGETYPENPGAQRLLLAQQLAEPVLFQQCVENAIARGITHFVEVGPGRQMCGLIEKIGDMAGSVPVVALPLERGDAEVGLAQLLGRLAVDGVELELARWDSRRQAEEPVRRRFTVPVCGANARPSKAIPAIPSMPAAAAPPRAASGAGGSGSGEGAAAGVDEGASAETGSASQATPPEDAGGAPAPAGTGSRPAHGVAMTAPRAPRDLAPTAERPQGGHQGEPVVAASRGGVPAQGDWLRGGLEALLHLQDVAAQAHREFLASHEAAAERVERLLAASVRFSRGSAAPDHGETAPASAVRSREEDAGWGGEEEGVGPVAAPATSPTRSQPEATEGPVAPATATSAPAGGDAAAATSPAARRDTAADRIDELVLAVVAERTGYPEEMLELEMELDADLGIDSIKRVEILSALQERLPEARVPAPDELAGLTTLAAVVAVLRESSGAPALPSA
ncbi:MAG: acyltransferase domain-containing protein, partial [Acidobacteria bacterium]